MKIFLAYVVFTASSKYSSGDTQESLRSAWSTYESAMIAAKEGGRGDERRSVGFPRASARGNDNLYRKVEIVEKDQTVFLGSVAKNETDHRRIPMEPRRALSFKSLDEQSCSSFPWSSLSLVSSNGETPTGRRGIAVGPFSLGI